MIYKFLLILLSLLFLNSCFSDNIVGKKILCQKIDYQSTFGDHARAYEFMSDNLLVRISIWFDEDLNLFEAKRNYQLTTDRIEVFLSNNKIDEIINRKDLSINMPYDTTLNYAEGECKMIRGDIKEKLKKIHSDQKVDNKINLLDRINNFFDKLLYKI